MGFSERYPTERNREILKKWKGPFMITKLPQAGRLYRLNTSRAAHFENNNPHKSSTEDWCIP